jgi:hypothetical protein
MSEERALKIDTIAFGCMLEKVYIFESHIFTTNTTPPCKSES